jgi:hypothetical protein
MIDAMIFAPDAMIFASDASRPQIGTIGSRLRGDDPPIPSHEDACSSDQER